MQTMCKLLVFVSAWKLEAITIYLHICVKDLRGFLSHDLQYINKKLLEADNSGWKTYLSTLQISVNGHLGTQVMNYVFVNTQKVC